MPVRGRPLENDAEADAYEPTGFGGDDRAVDVSRPGDGECPER